MDPRGTHLGKAWAHQPPTSPGVEPVLLRPGISKGNLDPLVGPEINSVAAYQH